MMHYVFEAEYSESTWTATWSGDGPEISIIVTEGATWEELERMVEDAIHTHQDALEDHRDFSFEIVRR